MKSLASQLANGLSGADDALPWREWLQRSFASFTKAPFAQHHIDLWEWAADLRHGESPRPFIACWPRGGAKSTTVELACAWLGSQPKPARNYVLYVSETQSQADRHVTAIAGMLERVGISRAVNEYGASKGWRHTEIRASNGFNVTAMGLDSAMRGAKLDEFRPDLIVFDDIDGRHDTTNTVQKKIDIITTSIMPTGSTDAAIVVVQNMIHQHGIMAQLIDGRADFLHDRLPAEPIPAIRGLQTEQYREEDGTIRYRIVAGEPTWEGQTIRDCEGQIRKWGLRAFLREAQHDVNVTSDGIFKPWWWRYWQPRGASLPPVMVRMPDGSTQFIPAMDQPAWWEQAITSWDMTFKKTETGSFVAGLVAARNGPNGYLLDCFHERTDFVGAKAALRSLAAQHPEATGHVVEDKANGPAIVSELQSEVSGLMEWPVAGSKLARAYAAQPHVEAQNWYLPHPLLPGAEWVPGFIKELAEFTGEKSGEINDQVDAFSQADHYLLRQENGFTMGDVMAAMFGGA